MSVYTACNVAETFCPNTLKSNDGPKYISFDIPVVFIEPAGSSFPAEFNFLLFVSLYHPNVGVTSNEPSFTLLLNSKVVYQLSLLP